MSKEALRQDSVLIKTKNCSCTALIMLFFFKFVNVVPIGAFYYFNLVPTAAHAIKCMGSIRDFSDIKMEYDRV